MTAAADSTLAALYGVAPSVIAELRFSRCIENVHWCYDKGHVQYLAAGLELMPSLLGLEKKEGAAPASGTRAALVIVRICPSPIWVTVSTPDGKTADVRVRDNRRLQLRMKIECHQSPAGRWECVHRGIARA